jgi:hypothetical protein
MGVVPTLSEGYLGNKGIIPAVITCLKWSLTPQMGQGIHGGYTMKKKRGAEAKCCQQHRSPQYKGK